ncbi:MAG TPA: RNA polymerase sigma factor [Sedimentisphaerales bacterium]|nr:RNA polymerase sigma factor [Sedimentisphaerales bacterium]
MENADWNDIEACLDGDADAYKRLVQRYEGQVARLMWRFSPNRANCEKLVQDVFVEAYFSLKSYQGRGPLLQWLKKIGTRVGYRFWKEQDKRKKFLPLQDFDFVEKSNEDSIDPDTAAAILHALLDRLPRADRVVLTLMYFENCSTEEVARRTGWTRPAVKSRAWRARKKMKEIAEKENLLERLGWIR